MEDEKKVEEEVKEEDKVEEVKEETVEEVKEEPKKEEKKKGSNGVMVCLVVVALLLIAIICVLLGRGGDGDGKTKKASKNKNEYYSEYRIPGNSLSDFDLYFMQLENNGKNQVYSPLSIKYALQMLAEGSSGATRAQIDAIIGDYSAKKYTNSEHMSFANAMFIRNTYKEKVKDEYTNLLSSKYSADIVYDPFENANAINSWVSDKTFKLINNLVDDEAVKEANFYLVNALAIDMKWNNLIQCQTGASIPCKSRYYYSVSYRHEKYDHFISTIEDEKMYPAITFNEKDNTKALEVGASFNRYDIVKELGEENIRKTVGDAYREWLVEEDANAAEHGYTFEAERDVDKYLDQYIKEINENYGREDSSSDFYLYVDDDVKVFAKDLQTYDGLTLQYVGMMPKNDKLQDFIEDMNAEKASKYISSLKELKKESFKEGVVTKVTGKIPVFKFDYELDLLKDLQSLNIEDVFDINKADLSGMLVEGEKQYIFDAKHKADIEFSNEGIKAAAATAMGGAGAASGGFDYLYEVPVEIIDITFDNPYIFFVRDKDTGEVWFAGTVYTGIQK